MNRRRGAFTKSPIASSLYFTRSKTSDMNATARRFIEDALLRRYERRAMLVGREGGGWDRGRSIRSREKDRAREREREKDGKLIREGAEWEGERFYTGYPLEGSGARDSHRHARAACRYKRRRSYY